MASCYVCGAPGARNRRWVDTGTSTGTFVSRRSFGVSARQYTGLRTVCDGCASALDTSARATARISRVCGWMAFVLVASVVDAIAMWIVPVIVQNYHPLP
jgi:hypothetical protein